MKRSLLLLAALTCAALTKGDDVRFLQPKSRMILSAYGGAEVPVQIRIEPNVANRGYRIDWDGGATARSLDGDQEAATQPSITIRVFESQTIVATVFGSGGKVLSRATMDLEVH